MDYLAAITSLTVSEYRWFRKGLTMLMRYGVSHDEACNLLLARIHARRGYTDRLRIERRA